jgi:predicted histone-like DNA-binding protein
MKYQLKKETKPTLSTFGKYKAVASHNQTVETEQLIKEICANDSYSEGTVTAVIWKMAQVVNRHLRNGDKVRLKDFGMMKLEIESDKVDAPQDFKPRQHIKGVRLHFIPESTKGKPDLYKNIIFKKE